MNTNQLPSIFDADTDSASTASAAPSFVTRLTAHVLGALITERVLSYGLDPWATIEATEQAIAAAVDRAINGFDPMELNRALDARAAARAAHTPAAE